METTPPLEVAGWPNPAAWLTVLAMQLTMHQHCVCGSGSIPQLALSLLGALQLNACSSLCRACQRINAWLPDQRLCYGL